MKQCNRDLAELYEPEPAYDWGSYNITLKFEHKPEQFKFDDKGHIV